MKYFLNLFKGDWAEVSLKLACGLGLVSCTAVGFTATHVAALLSGVAELLDEAKARLREIIHHIDHRGEAPSVASAVAEGRRRDGDHAPVNIDSEGSSSPANEDEGLEEPQQEEESASTEETPPE